MTEAPDMIGETAQAYSRRSKRRVVRLFKADSARGAVHDFGHDDEITVWTFGQFSIVDVLAVLLNKTGPVDLVAATWTAASADFTRVFELMRDGRIRSARWILDRSFRNRAPEFTETMTDQFGADNIRAISTHTKFLLLGNDDWHVVVRTSMNLNENHRLEYFDVIDDEEFYLWHLGMVDGIFRDRDPGDWSYSDMDEAITAAGDLPPGTIRMGVASAPRCERGEASVGPYNPA